MARPPFLWTGASLRSRLSLVFDTEYARRGFVPAAGVLFAAGFVTMCYPTIWKVMKAGIHPAYTPVKVICACGSQFETRSSHKGDVRLEICSACHPFFTGKQKLIDTEGRVDRFQKKLLKSAAIKAARETASAN